MHAAAEGLRGRLQEGAVGQAGAATSAGEEKLPDQGSCAGAPL